MAVREEAALPASVWGPGRLDMVKFFILPFRRNKKRTRASRPRWAGGEDTLVLSAWQSIMAGSQMSRKKDVVSLNRGRGLFGRGSHPHAKTPNSPRGCRASAIAGGAAGPDRDSWVSVGSVERQAGLGRGWDFVWEAMDGMGLQTVVR